MEANEVSATQAFESRLDAIPDDDESQHGKSPPLDSFGGTAGVATLEAAPAPFWRPLRRATLRADAPPTTPQGLTGGALILPG